MVAVVDIDALLAARTLWHAGRSAVIAADGEPTGHAALDALLPQGGWPRRALTELLLPADGVGELSLLLPTLARCTQQGERVAVIAPPYLPYAPAWQAAGVDLAQLRIIDASPRDALWAFEQCLRSGACAAVLSWPQQADARALRRLQVAADSGQCLGFALRDRRHLANPSPAALRLEAVTDARGTVWQVRKCRGGPVPSMPFIPEVQADPASPASSPACGREPGWGPAGLDAAPRASGAPPSAFGTFPRRRGKEEPIPLPARSAPSPACGEGSRWGPAGLDAVPRAFDASPSAFGTFSRRRGKEEPIPLPARPAPSPACGGGSGWGPAGLDAAPRAFDAPPSAFGTRRQAQGGLFLRERGKEMSVRLPSVAAPAGPHSSQHELPLVPATAPLARD